MSREYIPDRWSLVKLGKTESPHYRIFGSWHGGFAYGDSWKLSSGLIEDAIVINDSEIVLPQVSGSTYKVTANNYGASSYGYSVICGFISEANNSGGTMIFQVLSQEEALALLKSLTKE